VRRDMLCPLEDKAECAGICFALWRIKWCAQGYALPLGGQSGVRDDSFLGLKQIVRLNASLYARLLN